MSGEELYLAKLTCFKSPLLIVEKGRYQYPGFVLFGGTVPPACMLFGGTVPPACVLFRGTVPLNN